MNTCIVFKIEILLNPLVTDFNKVPKSVKQFISIKNRLCVILIVQFLFIKSFS